MSTLVSLIHWPALLLVVALAAAAPARAAQQPEIVRLSEADVTGMISAMQSFSQIGVDYAPADGIEGKPSADAFTASAAAQAVLARNNFSPERFSSVAHSVGMALAALQIDADQLEQAMQQQSAMMEQMRAYLSPEQVAQMRTQMEQSREQIARMREQPPGNIDLVRRHQAELQAVMAGIGRR